MVYTYTDANREIAYVAIKREWETETADGLDVACIDCMQAVSFVEMGGIRYIDWHTLNAGYFVDWCCDCYGKDD
jgi:hypothetical protein